MTVLTSCADPRAVAYARYDKAATAATLARRDLCDTAAAFRAALRTCTLDAPALAAAGAALDESAARLIVAHAYEQAAYAALIVALRTADEMPPALVRPHSLSAQS